MNGATVTSAILVGTLPGGWSVAGTGDFDSDGVGDILLRHTSGGVGIWFMNSDGTVRSKKGVGSVPVGTWTIAGTGDFNGDKVSDILFRSSDGGVALWLMNSNGTLMSALGVGSVAIAWSIAQTGDFNNDGKSDILWHNTDGSVALWLMDSATVTPLGIGAVTPDWQIQGMNTD
jgi:hypothetical protein